MKVLVTQLCLTLCDSIDCNPHQALLSMEFSRQEYWSGPPFPSPGGLLGPGIEPMSAALAGGFFEPPGKPTFSYNLSLLFLWTRTVDDVALGLYGYWVKICS